MYAKYTEANSLESRALAQVNYWQGNREDVGKPLVAQLELLKHELHREKYPEQYAA